MLEQLNKFLLILCLLVFFFFVSLFEFVVLLVFWGCWLLFYALLLLCYSFIHTEWEKGDRRECIKNYSPLLVSCVRFRF